jgi:hypothetical protein
LHLTQVQVSSLRKPKNFALSLAPPARAGVASFAVQFLAEGSTALNGETTHPGRKMK